MNLFTCEFQISLTVTPSVSCFKQVMSECTHCSKMGLLRNRTVNTRCLLIIYRICFTLSISNYFLKQVVFSNNSLNWGVFRLLINSHRSNPFQRWGQFMFEALLSHKNSSLWGEPTAIHSCLNRSSMHIFAQSCKNLNMLLLALDLPSLLFSLQITTLDTCAFLSK
jgi:hypothetical protein